MKTSDEFVIYRISLKKVNEYLGQKIHRVNEFDFFPNLMTEQSVSLSYAYLIHAKKKFNGSQFVDPINDEQV